MPLLAKTATLQTLNNYRLLQLLLFDHSSTAYRPWYSIVSTFDRVCQSKYYLFPSRRPQPWTGVQLPMKPSSQAMGTTPPITASYTSNLSATKYTIMGVYFPWFHKTTRIMLVYDTTIWRKVKPRPRVSLDGAPALHYALTNATT